MAIYHQKFGAQTLDVAPSGWTARWNTSVPWLVKATADAEGGRSVRQVGTSAVYKVLSLDAVDADADRANVEVLVRFKTSSTSGYDAGIVVRASGTEATRNGYAAQLNGDSYAYIYKYVNGSRTQINLNYAQYTHVANTWYWMRFRVNGTSLRFSVWKDGLPESSGVTLTGTDSAISTAGWCGLFTYDSNGTRDFDYVGVGTNGDVVVPQNSTTTTIRETRASVDVVLSGFSPIARVTQVPVNLVTQSPSDAQVTQQVVEAAWRGTPTAQVTQHAVEVAWNRTAPPTDAQVSAQQAEVAWAGNPEAQITQHLVEVAWNSVPVGPPAVAMVEALSAEVADVSPSTALAESLAAEVTVSDPSNAVVSSAFLELARQNAVTNAVSQFLAVEVACRTEEEVDATFPVLKRLNLEEGTWDGERRKWEVRLFRQNSDHEWGRLKTPAPQPVDCQFTYLASGGMADAHVNWPVPFTAEQALLDGDRMEVWVKRGFNWEVWYRGTFRNGEGASGRPGSYAADFYGPMELCTHVDVTRRYAMPAQDISQLFARLIDDYLDPRRAEAGLPPVQRQLAAVGEEVGTRDFSGNLLDAFNSLADGVPGLAWGMVLTPEAADEFFLLRQDTLDTVYNFALGKDASSASLGYDSKGIVTSLEITGAANEDPNLITNGGFERPTGEAQNALQNGGFEEGDEKFAAHWRMQSGEPSRKRSAQDNVNAHSGEWFMEIDNYKSGTEEIRSDFTELLGEEGVTETYGFRFWYAAEDDDAPIGLTITVHVFDEAEVEQELENLTWTISCNNQRWREFFKTFPLTGRRKFKVSFRTPSGGGANRGAAVDEVSLYSLKSIRQENWGLILNGGPDVQVRWDASPAPQGDYYVEMSVDTTGADQSVKLRPDQSFSLRIDQQVEFSVMLRYWPPEGGPTTMDVQIGVEMWNGTDWILALGPDDPGMRTVSLSDTDWTVCSVTALGASKTQEARPFVIIPQGQEGTLGIDAAMVLRGSGSTVFQEGEANFHLVITTDEPDFQADPHLTAEQKASLASMIARYGTREDKIDIPEVRTRAQALRYALNYFLQHADAKTPGPVSLVDRLRLVRPDGMVRLSNVPGVTGLKALFPVSVTHRLDRSGWKCDMERDMERPNDPRLWKELKTEIVSVSKVARQGVEYTLTNQQRG